MSYDSQERRRAWESEQAMEEERDAARDAARELKKLLLEHADPTNRLVALMMKIDRKNPWLKDGSECPPSS